ncbi:MAG: divalent-cation tolerance protein CutA [Gemmatimonadota bacterium]
MSDPPQPASGTEVQVVLVTAPDTESAQSLGRAVVEEQLAACVNLIPGVHSIYRWEGSVETDDEVLLLVKTTRSRLDALIHRVHDLHPYDLPEVLALPVTAGLEGYLAWVGDETRAGGRHVGS